jgi:hypothetical protein
MALVTVRKNTHTHKVEEISELFKAEVQQF